jgi:RNA polymerase sigma-70 factor (ECF subfamily)
MSTLGSQNAFVDLLDRHRGILLKIATAYCTTPADREDLAQEMIVQLWRAYPRFDGRARFSTWMYRVAMNVAISFQRSQTRKSRTVVPADASVFERISDPREAQPDDRLSLVRDLVEQLDPPNRALMLLYLDDYAYTEIAEILGISETNVATKIGRIKERLRRSVTLESHG